ncbi:PucR family transcriptional regulator [Intrasporangium mesophilum]
MPVPLAWLLAQDDLGLRLVSGPADRVLVDWAHAIELEDPTPYLSGGELVLTTGLRLPRTVHEQTAYVDRLAGVGVAALAFGTGVRFTTIPRGVVTRSADVGLPLLEVPLATPFIAVTQRVAHRLSEQQQESLQRVVAFQQSLTRRMLRDGPAGLVSGLAAELHAPVVLLDEHGRTVAASSRGQSLTVKLGAELVERRPSRSHGAIHRVRSDSGGAQLHAVHGRNAHRGWLAVGLEELDPDQRPLVHHAVALATLQLDRPRELEEARLSVGATVLGLLLGQAPADPALVRQLLHLGFAPQEVVRLLVLQTARPAIAEPVVQSQLTAAGVPHALVRVPPGLVALVADRDTPIVLERVRQALADAGAGGASVGVSGACEPGLVAYALVQARRAARTARLTRVPVEWFDHLTLDAVLDDTVVRERVRALSEPSLAALRERDEREGALLRTLEVFLDNNGSWETAARALGIHRHTLRNRITRIEQLTGLGLDVAQHRVVLALALATRDSAESGL